MLLNIISVLVALLAFTFWYIKPPKEIRWDWDKIKITPQLTHSFPNNFLWGTSTAAHQVEGDCNNNQWWDWEQRPGKIKNGDKSGKAVDHWNLYPHDVQLMKKIGTNAYRFSVEWSKVEPSPGKYSKEVIKHYEDVIDELLKNGIEPMITLHHFTEPLWFAEAGGFEKEENMQYFVNFAEHVFNAFSSKVKYWCTFNEPGVFWSAGWIDGGFPPGKKMAVKEGAIMLGNLLETHVRVYRKLKSLPNGKEAKIGIVKNYSQMNPYHSWNPIEWLICYVADAAYNESILRFFETGVYDFKITFFSIVKRVNPHAKHANDFIGLNYYSNNYIKFQPFNPSELIKFEVPEHLKDIKMDMPYVLYPEGFYNAIQRVEKLGLPIIVTENGAADAPDNGRRAKWIPRYLYAMSKAMNEGANIVGYFYWSLMDNFEWAFGWSQKFGLYEVDLKSSNFTRTFRKGSQFYADAVKEYNESHKNDQMI